MSQSRFEQYLSSVKAKGNESRFFTQLATVLDMEPSVKTRADVIALGKKYGYSVALIASKDENSDLPRYSLLFSKPNEAVKALEASIIGEFEQAKQGPPAVKTADENPFTV